MAAPPAHLERSTLGGSIAVTSALSVVGVVGDVAAGSPQMIVRDGIYGFVGIVLSWLLIRSLEPRRARTHQELPVPDHEAATPLVIGIQGFVLAATLIYAAVEGVYTIRAGGERPRPGWAILYWSNRHDGVSSLPGGGSTDSRRTPDVLTAEATAWHVGAIRGVGMVIGFTIMALLIDSRWDSAAVYVDPAMVLITHVLSSSPHRSESIRTTVLELLEGTPSGRPADSCARCSRRGSTAVRHRTIRRADHQDRSEALRRGRRIGATGRNGVAAARSTGCNTRATRGVALRDLAQRRTQPSAEPAGSTPDDDDDRAADVRSSSRWSS